MIVDPAIFEFWQAKYTCKNPIERRGIIVNEDTEEAIVEIYFKPIQILPIPNMGLFRFSCPKTILCSRKATMLELTQKIKIGLSSYMFHVLKEKSMMITEVRLWKSLINNLEEIEANVDKKFKNYTQVKIDATPIYYKEDDKSKLIED